WNPEAAHRGTHRGARAGAAHFLIILTAEHVLVLSAERCGAGVSILTCVVPRCQILPPPIDWNGLVAGHDLENVRRDTDRLLARLDPTGRLQELFSRPDDCGVRRYEVLTAAVNNRAGRH